MTENAEAVLGQIKTDLDQKNKRANDTDMTALADEELAKQNVEYASRNKSYTKLLDHYVKERKSKDAWKKWFKCVFFVMVMLAFGGTVHVSLLATTTLIKKSVFSFADVGIAASALAGLLSAFIILPKIIAEHLFPMNEETNLIDIVKSMQENDTEIKRAINGNRANGKSAS